MFGGRALGRVLKVIAFQAGGNAAAVAEMNKELDSARKQVEKAKEEASRSSGEMERLLQLVQMSQEEQNAKEKTIMELQQYVLGTRTRGSLLIILICFRALKTAQQKLRTQQQAAAQLEEQRKKEEVGKLVFALAYVVY